MSAHNQVPGISKRNAYLTGECWQKIFENLTFENQTYSEKIEEIIMAWNPEN